MIGDDLFGVDAETRAQWEAEADQARRSTWLLRVLIWGVVAIVIAGAMWGLR